MSKKPSASLDKNLRVQEDTQVAMSSFTYFFTELCNRANTVPTKALSVDEVEKRLADLGYRVGARLVMLASVRDSLGFQRRPVTVESVLNLVREKLWLRWFGKPATDLQKESGSDRFFIYDSDPMVTRYVHPSVDYLDDEGRWRINHASYMAGMVKGALHTIGFPAEVMTYHQPDTGRLHNTLFVIDFAPHVWDREKRPKI